MSFKSNIKILVSFSLITRVFAFISSFILAYHLGLSEYGEIVVYQSIWGMVSSLGHGGFYKLLFVSNNIAHSHLKAVYIFSLTLSLIVVSIWSYLDPKIDIIVFLLFVISSFLYFRTFPLFIYLEKKSEFKFTSKIRLVNQVVFSALLLILCLYDASPIYSFCFSLLLSQFVTYYFMRYHSHHGRTFKSKLDLNKVLSKGDVKDASYNFLSTLGTTLITQGDKVIISKFLGTSTVGIYNLFNMLIVQTVNIFGQSFYKPLLNAIREDNNKIKLSWFLLIISILIVILLWGGASLLPQDLYAKFSKLTLIMCCCFITVAIFKIFEWVCAPVLDFNRKYNVRFFSVIIQFILIASSITLFQEGKESMFLSIVILSQAVTGLLSFLYLKVKKYI